jgi:hypothetical protein
MTGNRLRLEALEDRWNLSPLDLSAAVVPAPASDHLLLEQVAMNYTKLEIDVRGADLGLAVPSADPVPAGFDALLEIDGIAGESGDDAQGVGGGGGAGKVQMQDTHFVAKASKASPKLFLACATGSHIAEPSAPSDLATDGSVEPTIAMGGYIRVKKLNSGG